MKKLKESGRHFFDIGCETTMSQCNGNFDKIRIGCISSFGFSVVGVVPN